MAVININRNQFEEMVHSGKTVLVEYEVSLKQTLGLTNKNHI